MIAIFGMVAAYPQFKEGIAALYDDATHVGNAMLEEFQKATGISDEGIISKRLVPKNIESVHELTECFDSLLTDSKTTDRKRSEALDGAYRNLKYILSSGFSNDDRSLILNCLPFDRVPELPAMIEDVLIWDRRRKKHLREEHRLSRGTAAPDAKRRRMRYKNAIVL